MHKRIFILVFFSFFLLQVKAQAGDRRTLTKQELQFLSHTIDSVKKNLNRMILFEKELMQRNYYLNEKTALVDELIATVKYLQTSIDVIAIKKNDVRKIFGKAGGKVPGRLIYDIETYKSNCPFMEITFHLKEDLVTKVEYRITDCQKWR